MYRQLTVMNQPSAVASAALAYSPPSLSSASPVAIPSTGSSVTLSGSNFGAVVGAVTVLVNGVVTAVTMPVRCLPNAGACIEHAQLRVCMLAPWRVTVFCADTSPCTAIPD
jgi:hypothetical protein